MPVGLTNAPSSFQNYLNDILTSHLDVSCTANLDNVLLYSESRSEHNAHVRKVLRHCARQGCELTSRNQSLKLPQSNTLGSLFTTGIRMDPEKADTVQHWPTPRNVKDVQAFIGFANFYRRFIRNFSRIAPPLTKQTKKKR
ncbi:unnamed protein product [Zymoseptoria tritici ST99CH_1A5]|uniref:Reverse transcriptase domain-containing protein n=1 Tax=Zymoseptoria tritici ST99CH_1A5 TaxID=1276529 RepID=A0A1Y6M4T3_ZYMTR|nr:unnamed protein product [Zymoseptoria tritici ST99CH_1A5]